MYMGDVWFCVPLLVNIWSELRHLRWFSKHAALCKDFVWLLGLGNQV